MRLPLPRRALLLSIAPAALVAVAAASLLLLFDRDDDAGVDLPSGDALLAFAEFGPTEDRVYVAPPSDPADRRLVASIEHVEGWGINPAFSTAGSLAAYTVLAPGTIPTRDADAELWLLDLTNGERTRLARDADLLAQPAFDAAGRQLVYRSTRPDGRQEIVRVELDSRLRRVVHEYDGPFGVYPIGFAADGAIVYASLAPTGTDIYRVHEGEAPELVTHASDHIARDWRVSPNGAELSYLAPELVAERWVYRAQVVPLDRGEPRAVESAAAASEQFGPVWTPDGEALTLGAEAYPQGAASAITISLTDGTSRPLPAPSAGFDVPLAWSPNGRYLAARSFDGTSSYEPGRESVVVISEDGVRLLIDTTTELIFLGWLGRG